MPHVSLEAAQPRLMGTTGWSWTIGKWVQIQIPGVSHTPASSTSTITTPLWWAGKRTQKRGGGRVGFVG